MDSLLAGELSREKLSVSSKARLRFGGTRVLLGGGIVSTDADARVDIHGMRSLCHPCGKGVSGGGAGSMLAEDIVTTGKYAPL